MKTLGELGLRLHLYRCRTLTSWHFITWEIFFPPSKVKIISLSALLHFLVIPSFVIQGEIRGNPRSAGQKMNSSTSQESHRVHSELAAHIWEEMFPEKFLYLLPSMLLCGRVLDSLSPPVDAWNHKGDP